MSKKTDSNTATACTKKGCDHPATTDRYCRLHYIAAAQRRFDRQNIAKEKVLEQYISALTAKYPDRYLEIIKRDVSNLDRFKKTLKELDIENVPEESVLRDYQEALERLKKG